MVQVALRMYLGRLQRAVQQPRMRRQPFGSKYTTLSSPGKPESCDRWWYLGGETLR